MPEIFPISRMTVHSGSTLKCHIQVSMPRQINIVKLSVPSPLPSQVHGLQQTLTSPGHSRPCPGVGVVSQEAYVSSAVRND